MSLCKMGESDEKIYQQHRGLIRSMINSVVVNNSSVVDTQDLQQVGAIAVIVALRSYDPSLGSLSSYIRTCIFNALLEQANSFNGVFTVDEKVRRKANMIVKLRVQGLSDGDIMTRLGIKTRATFLSLLGLVTNSSVDIDQADVEIDTTLAEDDISKILDEIGLTKLEVQFVSLTTSGHSMDDIMKTMLLKRTSLFALKASIKDKILSWGRDN